MASLPRQVPGYFAAQEPLHAFFTAYLLFDRPDSAVKFHVEIPNPHATCDITLQTILSRHPTSQVRKGLITVYSVQ